MKRSRCCLAFAAALLLSSCFEPPVVELLLLELDERGAATATLDVALAEPGDYSSPGVLRRMEERERALLAGTDPWLDRFAAIAAASDELSWHRRKGRLRSFSRAVRVDDPEDLAPLFVNDAALFSFERAGETSILELVPTRGGRATRKERQRVEREIANWSGKYADYLSAAGALDAQAVAHPEIARQLWRAVLSGDESDRAAFGDDERALVDRLSDRMLEATEALTLDPQEGFSLSERVRLVYHPFAAKFGVGLPCAATEHEGFLEMDDHGYLVPELALWETLERLEGRWLRVDPLRQLVERLRREDASEVDVEPFVREPVALDAPLPTAVEVATVLREALRPPDIYRLVWTCFAVPSTEPEAGDRFE